MICPECGADRVPKFISWDTKPTTNPCVCPPEPDEMDERAKRADIERRLAKALVPKPL